MLTEYKHTFDELNKKKIYHFASYISASQYSKAYNLVVKYGKQVSKVLDWGTGSGHFSYFLLTQGYDVTAFTIEDKNSNADDLQNSFTGKYKIFSNQSPVNPLPFDDESFDMIVSIGVLEHVRETGGTETNSLSEIRRILKPDGIFICYHFPNKYSWIESITKHLIKKHNHIYKYNYDEIKILTSNCKLELLEAVRYGIMPRNSFRFAPNSLVLTKLFNLFDSSLSTILNPFCQNYYFVARKTN